MTITVTRSTRGLAKLWLSLCLIFPCFAWSGTLASFTLSAGSEPSSVSHDYLVYTPSSYDGMTPLPMVFALHGCHQTEDTIFDEFGWDETAEAHNFIVVAPHSNAAATPTMENPECWNYWIADHQDRGEGMNVDLVRIGQQVEQDYAVDADRRYITGLSSGGFMTTIAIATYNDYWTAGVAMAGGGYKETSNSANTNSSCALNFTIYRTASEIAGDLATARNASPSSYNAPIMFMNSSYDCTVDIQGGITGSDAFVQFFGASIQETLDCGVSQIGCENKKYSAGGRVLVETYFYDGPSDDNPNGNFYATDKSKGHYFSGAKNDGQWAETWGQNAREAAWNFFSTYSRDGDITDPEDPEDPQDPGTDCTGVSATLDAHVSAGRAYTNGSSQFCEAHTSSNYAHVTNNRADVCNFSYACAKDDGISLGLYNTFTTSTVYESPANTFTTTSCTAGTGTEYRASGTDESLGQSGSLTVTLYEIATGQYSQTAPASCGQPPSTGERIVTITPDGEGTAGSWGNSQTLNGMNVRIYTPQNPPALGEKRALMVALHGCSMTNSDVVNGYNWEPTADRYGMVIAAPSAPNGGVIAGCWDYYGDTDQPRSSRDNDNLIGLAETLIANSSLNIDPDQVYISGLSSGGGQTLTTGCVAPDIFAGLGVNAGPAPGTSSGQIYSVVGTAEGQAATCESWSDNNSAAFDTQITSIVHGTSDTTVASGYGQRDFDVMSLVYGASQDSGSQAIAGGGTEITASVNDQEVVSYISVSGMGHSWPAGGGSGCTYCNTNTVNYPEFLADWLFYNNRRYVDDVNLAPVVTLNGDASIQLTINETFTDPGATATDAEDGSLPVSAAGSVDTTTAGVYSLVYSATDSQGATGSATRTVTVIDPNINQVPVITLMGDANVYLFVGDTWTDPGATATDAEDGNLAVTITGTVNTNVEGTYSLTYSATDSQNETVSVTRTVVVETAGNACYTDTVGNHLSAGRAYTFGGYVCRSVGGEDQLPTYMYTCEYLRDYGGNPSFSLEETSSGVFNKVTSCN